MLPEKYVITIGRTFGSGGRHLGRLLAERLGIGFYDKRLLVESARKAGYNLDYFERNDEAGSAYNGRCSSVHYGFLPNVVDWRLCVGL